MNWKRFILTTCAAAMVGSNAELSVRAEPQPPGDKNVAGRAQIVEGLVAVIAAPEHTSFYTNRHELSSESGSVEQLGLHPFNRKVVFHSGYQNLDPESMAQWAFELHQYVLSVGGGWENFRKTISAAQKEAEAEFGKSPRINDLRELRSYGLAAGSYRVGSPLPDGPQRSRPTIPDKVRTEAEKHLMVPYAQQQDFAKAYWEQHCHSYSQCPDKELWLYEAILDGNNIYLVYQNAGKMVSWGVLASLIKRR